MTELGTHSAAPGLAAHVAADDDQGLEATMLHEFLFANRQELVRRCREKVASRSAPRPTAIELEHGIPLFLDQLIFTLRAELGAPKDGSSQFPAEIGDTAEKHGNALLRNGFTVDQVVHSYGDLCQSVTELAAEKTAPVTVDEFRTFNRCLDNAIADAVTEFGRARDRVISAEGAEEISERLGSLAHELRNLLNSAILAFQAIKSGNVAVTGATGGVLDRSLLGLRDVIDRSLADVRLRVGLDMQRAPIDVNEFLQELQVSAALDARARGITFDISRIDKRLTVDADRQMLGSAVSNLLQNAFKFSRHGGCVSLTARAAADRILIEIEDECGGLPEGRAEELFRPFKQGTGDRSGLGLGLSISRRAVEANGGTLDVRSVVGAGCIFTIDLPRSAGN
jgi:signal transduction histidine kinase